MARRPPFGDIFQVASGYLTTSSTTVPADTGRGEGNDFFKGCILMPLAGAAAYQPRPIRSFTSVTGVFILDEPLTIAPGLMPYIILASDYPVQRLLDIFNLVNAMLESTETGGTITTDGAEQNIYINNAPAGVFEPLMIKLNLTNQLAAATLRVRTYYHIRPGGALLLQDDVNYVGVVTPPLIHIDLDPNRYGIQVTEELTAGANFALDWEVIYRV